MRTRRRNWPRPTPRAACFCGCWRDPAFARNTFVVYRFDVAQPAKRQTARRLWRELAAARAAVISSQVLAEFIHVARRQLRPQLTDEQLQIAVESLAPMATVDANKGLVLAGLTLAQRYKLSIFDAMIVQAAIDSGASILYSEGLQNGQDLSDVASVAICGVL
ncbi:MAG TPA: PIN domain-containing protein [Burkholderiaceae bacterium]|nr:PIN domain-containing protein [Burkholderiaceae bacterium]